MLRGINFEADNAEKVFFKLDSIMDVAQYTWYIDDTDLNFYIFPCGEYGGKEFKAALEELSLLSFARIRRYPAGAQIDCIDAYEDFIRSDCDFLMLFYDGGFYEVFGKDEKLMSDVMDLCQKEEYEKVRCVYDGKDERHYMHF